MSIYIKETTDRFDAIVIGSGISGGWAAKEFTERGMKTLMIERGPVVEHRRDYITEGVPTWDMATRGVPNYELVNDQHKIQKQCYAFNDTTKHFFGNDRDLPYKTAEGTKFSWIRGNQLGGKSLLWARNSFRWSDYDFTANKKDGYGIDWPIRYKDVESWYSYVEKHVGISGSKENLPQLPDSEFLPPFEMTKPEKDIKKAIEHAFPERNMIISRTAHLSKPQPHHYSHGRVQCQTRNECEKGCSFGAYFSTQSSTLPMAKATGNLKVAPNSVVHSLIYDDSTNRVIGVRVIDNEDLAEREYFAKVIFLCASTLGTTQILLNSKSRKFPNGIANSSGVVGHYLMDHNYNAVISGDIEGYEDEYYQGRRPTGIYIPNFNFEPDKSRPFKRGYAFGGSARRENWRSLRGIDGLGVEYKNRLNKPGKWKFKLHAQGEMLPRFENHVSLHPTETDKWGIPLLEINCSYSENEKLMMEHAADEGVKMLKAAGLTNVKRQVTDKPPGIAIHEMGTARMGRDPKISVLNGFNQSHDIPNLFVTDGACFASIATQNPSLTIMALTVRAVDYAVKELKAKRI
jgi:choline dehydrogenase-like flavoprotein